MSFEYAGTNATSDVIFTATAGAINPQDLWGGDPSVSSVPLSNGTRLLSWTVPPDWRTRTYTIWYTTSLSEGWQNFKTVTNAFSAIDDRHADEPVIFYKVTVQ